METKHVRYNSNVQVYDIDKKVDVESSASTMQDVEKGSVWELQQMRKQNSLAKPATKRLGSNVKCVGVLLPPNLTSLYNP